MRRPPAAPAPKLQSAHSHTSGSGTLQRHRPPSSKAHTAIEAGRGGQSPKARHSQLHLRTDRSKILRLVSIHRKARVVLRVLCVHLRLLFPTSLYYICFSLCARRFVFRSSVTPLISHHSSHTTHLTAPITHHSSHTTRLTTLITHHSSCTTYH